MKDRSVEDIAKAARTAAQTLATVRGEAREAAIRTMSRQLFEAREEVFQANAADTADARAAGLTAPLIKRLEITDSVFNYMLERLNQLSALPDPVGVTLSGFIRPDGLQVRKVSVPIGVVGIIYESRPNVTTDAAAVCLKSGNAVILRGGSEALRTNIVLADAMRRALGKSGLPVDALQIIRTPGHEAVGEMLTQDACIDVLIPRGGKALIRRIAEGTRIPVIKHYDGICHLYLAADADPGMAVDLVINSKCQRVEVCNALETLLVDRGCADTILPAIGRACANQAVEVRGCPMVRQILPTATPATEEDWATEYLAPILSVRIVDGLQEAIAHINRYGSGHTDGIVTRSLHLADQFVAGVDSASVLVNASTRLSGGGDYGMGAVVGISTDKLHARGPVGPAELTSYKWVATGNGHLR